MEKRSAKRSTPVIAPDESAAEAAPVIGNAASAPVDPPVPAVLEAVPSHVPGSREAREALLAAPITRKGIPGLNRLPTFEDHIRADLAQQAKAKKGAL